MQPLQNPRYVAAPLNAVSVLSWSHQFVDGAEVIGRHGLRLASREEEDPWGREGVNIYCHFPRRTSIFIATSLEEPPESYRLGKILAYIYFCSKGPSTHY